MTIKDHFTADKLFVLEQTTQYLQTVLAPTVPDAQAIRTLRGNVTALVAQGNITDALQKLEALRDAKTGIVITQVFQKDGCAPVIIRDARMCQNPAVRETESFEMQYLNAIRAAIDITNLDDTLSEGDKNKLNTQLHQNAKAFIENFYNVPIKATDQDKKQKELNKNLQSEIGTIADLLAGSRIDEAYTKLNIAKDFQNFNDTHCNVVTISALSNKKHLVVEAEVALKGLTDEQKQEYQKILQDNVVNQPRWFTQLQEWEQNICKKYAQQIIDGKHVMPTQLRRIVGMKNAFEKTTALFENDRLEILHTSKHAGTLASFSKDNDSRQVIANMNARQAKEWIGKDKVLHCNTFNSGPIVGTSDDRTIVNQTIAAMYDKTVQGKETNVAFNHFRHLSGASFLSGVKDTLKTISNSLDGVAFDAIKSYIEPQGFFGKLYRAILLKSPEQILDTLLVDGKIDHNVQVILREAIELRKRVEDASSFIRFRDPENISLSTSTKMNLLLHKISTTSNTKGLDCSKINDEILNMCASGKDRTGLAEHDQSAHSIAKKTGIDLSEVDTQLLIAGHTAQQAGGIYAGGATIGCFGTKSENKAGIPTERYHNLQSIVEVSSAGNKIKYRKDLKPANPTLRPVVIKQDDDKSRSTKQVQQQSNKSSEELLPISQDLAEIQIALSSKKHISNRTNHVKHIRRESKSRRMTK